MNGKLLGLVVLTFVLIGVAWKVSVDKAPQTEVTRVALSAGLIDRLNDVTRVDLRGEKHATTLQRNGDAWTVVNQDDFPADASAVRRLLLQLADLRTVEAKTSLPESYARIGVADTGEGSDSLQVELYAGEQRLLGLIVGHAREAGAQEQRYVRRVGDAQSWLVNGKVEGSADPITWLDARVVDIDTARVRRVTLTPAEGPAIVIAKAKPEDNFFELETVPDGKAPRSKALISSLGALLLDLRFNRVARAATAADAEPLRSATVETFDGLIARVEEVEKDGRTYARFAFSHAAKAPPPPDAPAAASTGTGQSNDDSAHATPELDAASAKETVEQEAQRLAMKTANWVYELPDYKRRLLAKRLDDLVQDASKAKNANEDDG